MFMICSQMTTPASTPESIDPREALDPREKRAARRLDALERLSIIGMALSEAMLARVSDAMTAGEAVDAGAVALEYSRLSRAVRQTVALEARLDAGREDLAKRVADERAARRERAQEARAQRMESNSGHVNCAVSRAIEAQAGRGTKRARLLNERLETLMEDPRDEDDYALGPVSALVARLCASLGVPVDWSLWKNEDWAAEEWRAGVAGSPYADASRPAPGRRDEEAAPEASSLEPSAPRASRTPLDAPQILCASQPRPRALEEAVQQGVLARGPPG
jgi:hypothetical protein